MSRMRVNIYKHDRSNSSNDGISAHHNEVMLIWDSTQEDIDIIPTLDIPAVKLNHRTICGETYLNARPLDDKKWWMFGGCFIYSSDSRFPSHYPIPLHDRFEG